MTTPLPPLQPEIDITIGQRKIMQRLVERYSAELDAIEEYSRQCAEKLGVNLSEYNFDITPMKFIKKGGG